MTSHDDRSFQDGWGPGAFDTDDWRAGDRDHGQHQQRREHADDDRPNLLRRWLDRALGMGTPGEWASDFAAALTLAALFVCMFVFATIFGS